MDIKIKANGTLREEEVAAFEHSIGYLFPADYREFLLATNGGAVENGSFKLVGCKYFQSVTHFYGIGEAATRNWDRIRCDLTLHLPPGFMAIGSDEFSCLLVLDLNPGRVGVYYYDGNIMLPESLDKAEDDLLYYVCRTLTEFFPMCTSEREAWKAWGDPGDLERFDAGEL